MGKRLYVGNFSYSLKSNDLAEVFRQVGEVASAKVITNRETVDFVEEVVPCRPNKNVG